MSQQLVRIALVLALLPQLIASQAGGEKKPDSTAKEKAAREALTRFDKKWKDYTNEPNFDDPHWKVKMETLVALSKTAAASTPLLEEAAKEGSAWAPHTRALATYVLTMWRENAAVRDAWANYDLAQLDIAKEGRQAPDFTLADASGRNHRLTEYRGKRTIVLTFILQDI
jgi:hypothetical protein